MAAAAGTAEGAAGMAELQSRLQVCWAVYLKIISPPFSVHKRLSMMGTRFAGCEERRRGRERRARTLHHGGWNVEGRQGLVEGRCMRTTSAKNSSIQNGVQKRRRDRTVRTRTAQPLLARLMIFCGFSEGLSVRLPLNLLEHQDQVWSKHNLVAQPCRTSLLHTRTRTARSRPLSRRLRRPCRPSHRGPRQAGAPPRKQCPTTSHSPLAFWGSCMTVPPTRCIAGLTR